ncbi:MAG: hypothetical protein K0S41_2251 [Anaerocolumna sp.]|jgi:ribosomal protein S18 acetylase RimI-like enzyme|nr:hypothetical protein [Anaerocolumna sp.]
MKENNNPIVIKVLDEMDLCNHKDILIKLLLENYKLNFPDYKNLDRFANANYVDMVRFTADKSAIILGAYENNQFLGFIWGYRKEFLNEKRIHIDHIVVQSQSRGKGIGTKLINQLEDIAKKEGIQCIDLVTSLNNENTVQFYNSKGFSMTRVQFEKKLG